MEKQYFCQFCHNRFKNKNEAERHQNSLHLRRHSWSCAALQSLEDAFHPTLTSNMATTVAAAAAAATTAHNAATQPSPNTGRFPQASNTDTCGYCGQEFPNPPDWNERVAHLNTLHKFGECNQGKKFFRADHFRQHLKHSHASTSGRWTNMLESACMREEPLMAPPPQIPMGMPGTAPMQGVPMQHMPPQMQQQQQAQQMQQPPTPQAPQIQQQPSQNSPQHAQSAAQQASMVQPMQQRALGTPMTEQQAQQTAQQATQEANAQGHQQTNPAEATPSNSERQSQPTPPQQ